MELHHGCQVGKAHVVGAGGDPRHRAARSVAGVDRDIEFGVLEITLGGGRQKQGGVALEAPVELELDGCGLRLRHTACDRKCKAQKMAEKYAFVHRGIQCGQNENQG